MHYFDAMISLLTNRGDFRRRLMDATQNGVPVALAKDRPDLALSETLRELLRPYESTCRELIGVALEKLRLRAGERGVPMPDGIELRASADLVLLDWGKSELQGDKLTMRLIATHAQMPNDPITVDRTVQVQ